MATTALQLITSSWYLSGLMGRGIQTVTAEQVHDGLERLNEIFDVATSEMGLIPYWRQYNFNTVAQQETYEIPDLVQVETLTFNQGPIRYSLEEATREQYFAYPRVDNIYSLPGKWHMERYNGGGRIYLYFVPNIVYQMRLWGKFSLSNVTLQTDLSLTYEGFYIAYLRYKLAQYLCEYYNQMFPISRANTLATYEKTIRNVSPLDLTQRTLNVFSSNSSFNYGDVNIGKGWRPSG